LSVTTEVKTLLSTVSNVTIGSMPDTPDNSVCIYNTGGYPKSLSGTFMSEPTFQIKVRNVSYAAAESLCETIIGLLHGKSTTKLLMIETQSEALDLGRDESNRSEMSINFRCFYRK